jgi:hypothetical protein
VKIKPQWVLTAGKQTNNSVHPVSDLSKLALSLVDPVLNCHQIPDRDFK